MAQIKLSDAAPNEELTFSIGNADSFTLSGSGSYSTDDGDLIASANEHPWLEVADDAAPAPVAPAPVRSVPTLNVEKDN